MEEGLERSGIIFDAGTASPTESSVLESSNSKSTFGSRENLTSVKKQANKVARGNGRTTSASSYKEDDSWFNVVIKWLSKTAMQTVVQEKVKYFVSNPDALKQVAENVLSYFKILR